MSKRRVVITGVGAVTPLGVGAELSFERLLKGESGVGPISSFEVAAFATRIAGECRDFQVEQHFPRIEAKKLDRFTQLALVAAKEALDGSGVKSSQFDPTRAGVVIGSGSAASPSSRRRTRCSVSAGPTASPRSSSRR